MELPDDVIKLIREYSSPSYPYWRAGSYVYKQLKKMKINFLEILQYRIVLKSFSYSTFNHLRLEHNLLKNCEGYRKFVNGESWSIRGHWHPKFGPKIPRPINFQVLIGNTKRLLKDISHGKQIHDRFNTPHYERDEERFVERDVLYNIKHHKRMKMRWPNRKFGYNDN
jgi:hypothetical protein